MFITQALLVHQIYIIVQINENICSRGNILDCLPYKVCFLTKASLSLSNFNIKNNNNNKYSKQKTISRK